MKRIASLLASDKPFVAAFGVFVAAVLASLGLADLSSSAVTVVDAVAGLVVTIYVGGSAHVGAQTAKAATVTAAATVAAATAPNAASGSTSAPASVQAAVADVLKAAADSLTASAG